MVPVPRSAEPHEVERAGGCYSTLDGPRPDDLDFWRGPHTLLACHPGPHPGFLLGRPSTPGNARLGPPPYDLDSSCHPDVVERQRIEQPGAGSSAPPVEEGLDASGVSPDGEGSPREPHQQQGLDVSAELGPFAADLSGLDPPDGVRWEA